MVWEKEGVPSLTPKKINNLGWLTPQINWEANPLIFGELIPFPWGMNPTSP